MVWGCQPTRDTTTHSVLSLASDRLGVGLDVLGVLALRSVPVVSAAAEDGRADNVLDGACGVGQSRGGVGALWVVLRTVLGLGSGGAGTLSGGRVRALWVSRT